MKTKTIKTAIFIISGLAIAAVNFQLYAAQYTYQDPSEVPAAVEVASADFINHQQAFQNKYSEWDSSYAPAPEGMKACFMGDNPRHGLLAYKDDDRYFTVSVSDSEPATVTSAGSTDLIWVLCTTGEVKTIPVTPGTYSGPVA